MSYQRVTELIKSMRHKAHRLQHEHGIPMSITFLEEVRIFFAGVDDEDIVRTYDLDRWDRLPHDPNRIRELLGMLRNGKKEEWARKELKKYGIYE